jgi:phage baseplate assembly protein W
MALFYGMNPPFIGGPQNILSRQEDEKLIKNDILQLLLTVPGERVNRPDFGTELRSFVFEPNSLNELSTLESNIASAIGRFETRVEILNLSITQQSDGHTIKVFIVTRLVNNPNVEIVIDRLIETL